MTIETIISLVCVNWEVSASVAMTVVMAIVYCFCNGRDGIERAIRNFAAFTVVFGFVITGVIALALYV